MTAVLLALASAALFGGMTIAVRVGLRDGGDAGGAALATVLSALCVTLVAAAFRHDVHHVWPFFLAGLLAPGASQILFTLGIREIGASRTSVTVGAAPLVAVAIALVFLGEPVQVPLVIGALAVVAGGVLLASERDRPGHLRGRGLLYAAGAAALFATRDNLVRALHGHASPETAAAATLVAGTVVAALWARRAPTTQELAAARAGRRPLRPLVHLPLRGLLARARHRRLAPRRDGVAVGRRSCRSADPTDRGDGAEGRAGCAPGRRGRSRYRRNSLAV